MDDHPVDLTGTIALVAGATRGAGRGIAVELGAAGATVYCTGRTTREQRSEYGRPETIEETAELMVEWDTPVWEHSLENGPRTLRLAIDTHLVTAHHALRLMSRRPGGLVVEITDGTADYNTANYRLNVYYDLAKIAPIRLARSWAHELRDHGGTAVAVTPGWLRSELMFPTTARTSTGHSPTRGATSSRCRTPVSRRTRPATASPGARRSPRCGRRRA